MAFPVFVAVSVFPAFPAFCTLQRNLCDFIPVLFFSPEEVENHHQKKEQEENEGDAGIDPDPLNRSQYVLIHGCLRVSFPFFSSSPPSRTIRQGTAGG